MRARLRISHTCTKNYVRLEYCLKYAVSYRTFVQKYSRPPTLCFIEFWLMFRSKIFYYIRTLSWYKHIERLKEIWFSYFDLMSFETSHNIQQISRINWKKDNRFSNLFETCLKMLSKSYRWIKFLSGLYFFFGLFQWCNTQTYIWNQCSHQNGFTLCRQFCFIFAKNMSKRSLQIFALNSHVYDTTKLKRWKIMYCWER